MFALKKNLEVSQANQGYLLFKKGEFFIDFRISYIAASARIEIEPKIINAEGRDVYALYTANVQVDNDQISSAFKQPSTRDDAFNEFFEAFIDRVPSRIASLIGDNPIDRDGKETLSDYFDFK